MQAAQGSQPPLVSDAPQKLVSQTSFEVKIGFELVNPI